MYAFVGHVSLSQTTLLFVLDNTMPLFLSPERLLWQNKRNILLSV